MQVICAVFINQTAGHKEMTLSLTLSIVYPDCTEKLYIEKMVTCITVLYLKKNLKIITVGFILFIYCRLTRNIKVVLQLYYLQGNTINK